jgi:hypothetical protein
MHLVGSIDAANESVGPLARVTRLQMTPCFFNFMPARFPVPKVTAPSNARW